MSAALHWTVTILTLAATVAWPRVTTGPLIKTEAKKKTEAVVITLGVLPDQTTVDPCFVDRVTWLAETSGKDIIVLLDTIWPTMDERGREPSFGASTVSRLLHEKNISQLTVTSQEGAQLHRFDTMHSGRSKSAFVRWVSKEQYDFVWHLESDVYFSGRWDNAFYLPKKDLAADIVALHQIPKGGKRSYWFAQSQSGGERCSIPMQSAPTNAKLKSKYQFQQKQQQMDDRYGAPAVAHGRNSNRSIAHMSSPTSAATASASGSLRTSALSTCLSCAAIDSE
jgi:hypothetical protein